MRWQLKALAKRFAAQPYLVAKYIEQETARLDERKRKRDLTVAKLERERDAELLAMTPGERRWEGHVRDSTETKLSMQYNTEDGIFYEPSGCIETASGELHVPWPLPPRRIAFPMAVSAAASRAAQASDSSASEEDEPPEEDEDEETLQQSVPDPPRRVTRRSAAAAATAAVV
jgi:hypothetical protein